MKIPKLTPPRIAAIDRRLVRSSKTNGNGYRYLNKTKIAHGKQFLVAGAENLLQLVQHTKESVCCCSFSCGIYIRGISLRCSFVVSRP